MVMLMMTRAMFEVDHDDDDDDVDDYDCDDCGGGRPASRVCNGRPEVVKTIDFLHKHIFIVPSWNWICIQF